MHQFARTGRVRIDGEDPDFVAGSCTSDEAAQTIRAYYQRYGYLMDPHTAVGVTVAERLADGDSPTLCLATAHPAKFPDTIAAAVGADVARHPAIDKLEHLPARCTVLAADKDAVQTFIRKTLAH